MDHSKQSHNEKARTASQQDKKKIIHHEHAPNPRGRNGEQIDSDVDELL